MQPHICLVVSSPFTLNAFLGGHLDALGRIYRVTVIANLEDETIAPQVPAGCELLSIRIKREIAIGHDLAALWVLWRLFWRSDFDCVHSISPKAGLLTMLAGKAAGVKVRLHTFTGQVWATRRGASRVMLKCLDRLLAACATNVFADSTSQSNYLVSQGVVRAGKISVLGAGSISGVDTARFRPDATARANVRAGLGIDERSPVLIYVGRMKREKGIVELRHAFRKIRANFPEAHLVLVGPDEDQLLAPADAMRDTHVHVVGYTTHVERYMAAADLLCLPSHREGFGSVIIEAAACGIPAVASRIYGLTDAIVDGETGLLHPKGDPDALYDVIAHLLAKPAAMARMAQAARSRALRDFSASEIVGAWVAFYRKHISDVKPVKRPVAG